MVPMQVIDHKHVEIDSSIVEASYVCLRHSTSGAVRAFESSMLVHAGFGTMMKQRH